MHILPTMLTLGTMFDTTSPTPSELARRIEYLERCIGILESRIGALERRLSPPPEPPPPRELWTRRQAAAHHGVSTRTIQTWEQDHGLEPTVRSPQGVLYDPETVRRFEPPSVQRRTHPCAKCGKPTMIRLRFCGEPCPRT